MSRPNILLITSDQQHWSTLGVLNPEIKTPNLDRLAQEGTLFTRAYCPNPTCTPTRASLITGKFPSQHGAYSLGTKLPESEPTIGEILRRNGYRTGLVGKAHFQQLKSTEEYPSLESYPIMQDLDFWRNFKEPFYGFEDVKLARNHVDEAHVGQHYAIWMEEKGFTNWKDYFREPTGHRKNASRPWGIPEEYHYNTWIAEETNGLLDHYQATGQNFFLWASFFDPHPPYLAPPGWEDMYDPAALTIPHGKEGEHAANPPPFQLTQQETPDFSAWQEEGGHGMHGYKSHLHDRDKLAQDVAVYYGMVSCMDKYIGKIIDHLDKTGQRENTLIVFTSDHGHLFGQHNLIAKGAFHYEDLIRVPFIVSMPGSIPTGTQSAAIQSLVDVPQTFLSLCDIENREPMTGTDQKDVWLGQSTGIRDHTIVENHHQPTTIHLKTYVSQRYKLTVYYNQPYGELFDLENDPGESTNLWDNADVQELKARLTEALLEAEMAKEEELTAETRNLPQKSEACYQRTITRNDWELTIRPEEGRYELFNLAADPERQHNLWTDPGSSDMRYEMVRSLLFERMGREPLWMPRVCSA